MSVHKFTHTQKIGVSTKVVWPFFSNPANLQKIMPPEMEIRMVGTADKKVIEGQIIEYQVKVPILGRKKWVSEIKAVEDGLSFTDVQKVGPYRSWEHKHIFLKEGEGTRLIDEIQYELPFGIVGVLGNMWLINRTLKKIFGYREFAVGKIWGLGNTATEKKND
jgi:ligand-binding SRPBCC domain-containing protein